MSTDAVWMDLALALAARAPASTSPNPRVGCVVVRDGRVVGSGFHRGPGTDHAETVALAEAGAAAEGATLYVNLEPCHHTGRTPPCTAAILENGIARVVAAIRDPDPRVDGAGFAALAAGGVGVETGSRQREALRLNLGFVRWHRERRPEVTLKAGRTADGLISARDGVSRWITGEEARRFVHRLRAEHDAILVGGATARADDPRLDVRLAGVGGSPLRVVLSGSLDLDPSARLFRGARRALVLASSTADAARVRRLSEVAEVETLDATPDGVAVDALLDALGRRGVQRLLVEGGGRVAAAFVRARRVDRVVDFRSPRIVGARGAVPWIDGEAVARPDRGLRLGPGRPIALGDDTAWIADRATEPEDR